MRAKYISVLDRYVNKEMEKTFATIACACSHDIDRHGVNYRELTQELKSGSCFETNCQCSAFRLKDPLVPLGAAQMERVRNPFGPLKASISDMGTRL